MPRGDKSAYTEKQKRQAEHIEEGSRAERGPDRRPGVGLASEVGAVCLGPEGRRNAEAQGWGPDAPDPAARPTGLSR
jgi:hypothetical protein